jgi:predicted glycosyltransferase
LKKSIILISGPEPQRSIFEKLLLAQLQHYSGSVLFVRGLPGVAENETTRWIQHTQPEQLVVKNHLSAKTLNEAIQQAQLVICRSGYTTIMDLVKLGQKAILVPTPGQTEQEYLASHLMKLKYFFAVPQEGFSLPIALKAAANFNFKLPTFDMDQYKKTVRQFVQSL